MANARDSRRLIVLLVVATVSLAQPATAMDVKIGDVGSSVRTTDGGGGGSYLGKLVKIVTDAIEEKAAQQRRQSPQQPA